MPQGHVGETSLVVILSIADLDMDSSLVCGMSSWYSLH